MIRVGVGNSNVNVNGDGNGNVNVNGNGNGNGAVVLCSALPSRRHFVLIPPFEWKSMT
jgi:hypothetical protein